jgi:hypothetical protein
LNSTIDYTLFSKENEKLTGFKVGASTQYGSINIDFLGNDFSSIGIPFENYSM